MNEGGQKGAIRWARLSCRLHALAYNPGHFLRALAAPGADQGLLTSLKEKLIKTGAKVMRHVRYVAFQPAGVVIPRNLRRHPAARRGTSTAASHINA